MYEITFRAFERYAETRQYIDTNQLSGEGFEVFRISAKDETPLYVRFHSYQYWMNTNTVRWVDIHVDQSIINLLNLGYHKSDTDFKDFLGYLNHRRELSISMLTYEEKARMLTLEGMQ